MFKETLKISPQLESSDLSSMERNLNSRFGAVAKKFGKGVLGALAGGGIFGLAAGILDKILNPLKEVQEALDRTLKGADDLQDSAAQFGTTTGELAKLRAFGKTKGLDAAAVDNLLQKFQLAVTEATVNPEKDSSVRQFVGQTNMAQAFLTFSENLGKLADKNQVEAVRVQQEVFGDRQVGKSGQFIRANFGQLNEQFSGTKTEAITGAVDKLGALNDVQRNAEAQRELKDFIEKARVTNKKTIDTLEEQKDIALRRENKRIEDTVNLAVVKTTVDSALALIEGKALPLLGQGIQQLINLAGSLSQIASSPLIRRFGLGGKKE